MRQQCATPSGEPGLHNASLQSSAMMYGLNKGCKLALDSNGDPVDLDQARPRCLSFVSSANRSSGLIVSSVGNPMPAGEAD